MCIGLHRDVDTTVSGGDSFPMKEYLVRECTRLAVQILCISQFCIYYNNKRTNYNTRGGGGGGGE